MTALSRFADLLPDKVFVRLIARVHRRFEPELGLLYARLPAGGTFLDVGAWYGPWSTWMARKATKVVALEPNPDVAAVLAGTAPANVEVVRAAASSEAGTATLSLPEGGRGTEGRASLGGSGGTRSVDVRLTTIDDLGLRDVRLVKIDVEGHELEALQGATTLLSTEFPVLAIELEERHGTGIAPTVELLAGLGYRGHVLVADRWVGLDRFDLRAHQAAHDGNAQRGYLANAFSKQERYVNNVVFVHPSSSWSPLTG